MFAGRRARMKVGGRPRAACTQTLAGPAFFQEHQGPALADGGSPKDSPAHEVTGGGGAYTRFDVPQPRIRRSWPSFRGGGGLDPVVGSAHVGVPRRSGGPSGCRPLTPAAAHSPAAAPLRGGPRHLGPHAVHRRDLFHHAVPVPGS